MIGGRATKLPAGLTLGVAIRWSARKGTFLNYKINVILTSNQSILSMFAMHVKDFLLHHNIRL